MILPCRPRLVGDASNAPYVSHLLAVSSLVIEHGGDEDQAIAALLHDAIEDQGGPKARDEIMRRFGKRVTDIVEGCTDSQAHRQRFVGGREGTLWYYQALLAGGGCVVGRMPVRVCPRTPRPGHFCICCI